MLQYIVILAGFYFTVRIRDRRTMRRLRIKFQRQMFNGTGRDIQNTGRGGQNQRAVRQSKSTRGKIQKNRGQGQAEIVKTRKSVQTGRKYKGKSTNRVQANRGQKQKIKIQIREIHRPGRGG